MTRAVLSGNTIRVCVTLFRGRPDTITCYTSCGFGGKFHYEFGPVGGNASVTTASFKLPQTSTNWTDYQTVSTTINLSAGPEWLKVYCDASGYNLDGFTISPAD